MSRKIKIIDGGCAICELFSANKFAIFYCSVNSKIKIIDGGYVICELFSTNKFAIFYCSVNSKIKIIDGGYVTESVNCFQQISSQFSTVGWIKKIKITDGYVICELVLVNLLVIFDYM